MPLGLIELVLIFGAVLLWSWIEYRKADRLAKSHKKDPTTQSENEK